MCTPFSSILFLITPCHKSIFLEYFSTKGPTNDHLPVLHNTSYISMCSIDKATCFCLVIRKTEFVAKKRTDNLLLLLCRKRGDGDLYVCFFPLSFSISLFISLSLFYFVKFINILFYLHSNLPLSQEKKLYHDEYRVAEKRK